MAKSIVCKFSCYQVARQHNCELVTLHAVSGEQNKPWSLWTPSGKFEVTITNPEAFGAFEPGKNYLLTVTEAPAEEKPAD